MTVSNVLNLYLIKLKEKIPLKNIELINIHA